MEEQEQKSEDALGHSESKEGKRKPIPKYVWIITVLAIVVVVTVLLSKGGYGTKKRTSTTTIPATEEALLVGKDAIAVTDYSAGLIVTVAKVVLSKPGYVVVHEDASGTPGAVLGNSKYLASGESTDVVVPLSRESTGGEVLFAMLHTDDGDRNYDFPGDDLPTKNEEGNAVLMQFTVEGEEGSMMEKSP